MIQKQPEKVSQHSDKTGWAKKPAALAQPDHYALLHAGFQWHVPTHFNIAQVCCARWAALPDASSNVAVIEHAAQVGRPKSAPPEHQSHTFAQLQSRANQLSNLLASQGVKPGDRVAIVMPQRFDTAVAYIAVLQMGAVAMPLSILFGPDALEYRLADSEAVVAIVDAAAQASLRAVRASCPQLRVALVVEDVVNGAISDEARSANLALNLTLQGGELAYAASMGQASTNFQAVDTLADQAAGPGPVGGRPENCL